MRRALLLLLLVAVGSACGGDDPPAAADPPPPPPTADAPAPPEPPSPAAGPPALELAARGLDAAVAAVARPGDGRLYVVEQDGRILVVDSGGTRPEPFLDLRGEVAAQGEQGLLGLAFHPDHADNGLLYVNHTGRDGTTRIVEFRAAAGGEVVAAGSARELLTVEQPFANHNGGGLAFGDDGYLYIGLGDGGSGGDPLDAGQRTDTLLGKMLRIDVDGRDGGRPYAIPPDNPFAGGGGAPEIWALGLRNPWRFSFDPADGSLWIGDVGQNAVEEIDRIPAGAGGLNLGWARFEGSERFSDGALADHHLPIAEYSHDRGCSVTGGHVYRGETVPMLAGRYVYGDFCSGRVWALEADALGEPQEILADARGDLANALTSFGVDASGELLIVARSAVYRIVVA